MSNVYAYMVTKNEADRYLLAALHSLFDAVDGIFVYDDRSTDGTVDLLNELQVPYNVRSPLSVGFQEDESKFRQDAWYFMEREFHPVPGDWIFSLDADEQLRTRTHLREVATTECDGLWMKIHEMWAPDQVRVDGYWGGITGMRFCEYKPGGFFVKKRMGGGSVPDYVSNASWTSRADILHYGYFNPDERQPKMERYLTNRSNGHNPTHIRSIILPPTLAGLSDLC